MCNLSSLKGPFKRHPFTSASPLVVLFSKVIFQVLDSIDLNIDGQTVFFRFPLGSFKSQSALRQHLNDERTPQDFQHRQPREGIMLTESLNFPPIIYCNY